MRDPEDAGGISFAARDTFEPVVVEGLATLPTGGGWVPRVDTPIDDVQLRAAMIAGHLACFAVAPSPNRASVAWAMQCLEVGRGRALHNFNFGNTDEVDGGPRFPLRAREVIDGRDVFMTKGLAAYDTAAAGAKAYWHKLATNYLRALAVFDSGNGSLVAHELKLALYFTEREEAYAVELVSLIREYHRRWPDR